VVDESIDDESIPNVQQAGAWLCCAFMMQLAAPG
jgi:hypothetical protein